MALRTILTRGDETLEKKAKEVKDFGERTHTLLDDMWETMYDADGVGLAAPQVGVLRRAIVIDVTPRPDEEGAEDGPKGDGADEVKGAGANKVKGDGANEAEDGDAPSAPEPVKCELLNPVILESEGGTTEKEGCLSVPGIAGYVRRPTRIKVKALDRNGDEVIVEGEGMLAKALSHEIDHLEGILFTEVAERLEDVRQEQQE
jgi:peptide deformylase